MFLQTQMWFCCPSIFIVIQIYIPSPTSLTRKDFHPIPARKDTHMHMFLSRPDLGTVLDRSSFFYIFTNMFKNSGLKLNNDVFFVTGLPPWRKRYWFLQCWEISILRKSQLLLLQHKIQIFFIKLKTFNVWMEKELINGLEWRESWRYSSSCRSYSQTKEWNLFDPFSTKLIHSNKCDIWC